MPGIADLFGAQAPQAQPVQNAATYAQNYANQGIENQLKQAQTANVAQDMQQKQRSMQLSMLNGVLTESDPEKQRALLQNIVPIANRLNPSYQIDPGIDIPTVRALVQSQHPLENTPPANYLQGEGQNLSPLIKAGLQSGQLNLKDVVTAQATNPFMNIGNPSGAMTGEPSGSAIPSGAAAQANAALQPAQPDYMRQLQQLPPGMQPTVKAIIEGREMPPSPNSRAPGAAALVQAVNAVDPDFDFTSAGKRQSTAKDFASGGSANSVTSLNTLAGHLGKLETAWDGLNNVEGSGLNPLRTTMNSMENRFASGAGAGALKSFGVAKSAVSDELSKLLKGGVVSDTEKKEWESAIDQGATPTQQKAVLSEISGIIESRLDALNNKYHEGMGPVNVDKNWATPQSKSVFDRLQGREVASENNAATQAQGSLKQPAASIRTPLINTQAAFDALPSGAIYAEPDGKKYRKP